MPVRLDTERLWLREFRGSDHDAYAAMLGDPQVMQYIGDGKTVGHPESWRAIASMLGHWQLRGYGMWAIEEKATGTLLGRAGFIDPPGWPGFELGWLLGRAHWGRGYATEAAKRCLQYAFEDLRRDHVISLIRPSNKPSIRVAERLGEKPAGEIDLFGAEALVYEIRR